MGSEAELRQSLGVVEAEPPRRDSLTSRTPLEGLTSLTHPHAPSHILTLPHPGRRRRPRRRRPSGSARWRRGARPHGSQGSGRRGGGRRGGGGRGPARRRWARGARGVLCCSLMRGRGMQAQARPAEAGARRRYYREPPCSLSVHTRASFVPAAFPARRTGIKFSNYFGSAR